MPEERTHLHLHETGQFLLLPLHPMTKDADDKGVVFHVIAAQNVPDICMNKEYEILIESAKILA